MTDTDSLYASLAEFIQHRMRMSHVYQPVMLMTLLQNAGRASTTDIARAILAHDQSQIEYYENVTRGMVGRVLRRHGLVERKRKTFHLVGFDDLSEQEIQRLVDLCQAKLEEYVEQRGRRIWEHRRKSASYVPGTLRYEVLKRARYRCELCGISAEEKALEVDHILPRNRGGSDDMSNLQALCYSCNATKRDRDDTDFRSVRGSYEHREPDCLFCEMPAERVILENELAYATRDGFPVTPLHTLIVPKRHVASYFELAQPEVNACTQLLREAKAGVVREDDSVSGFNVGINDGANAGQTIFHCHIHLIPRRAGDVQNPRGGIRHVISGKGAY